MSTKFSSRTAIVFVSMALLATALPFSVVSADNAPGGDDGLAVIVQPRQATAQDNTVVVSSVNGLFVFDYQLFTATGAPFYATKVVVDLNSEHNAGGHNGPSGAPADLIWTRTFDSAATSSGTIRVPAEEMAFIGPLDGVALTINVVYDGAGNYLCGSNGVCPSGQFSLPANAAAAKGNWAAAAKADEAFTPLVLVDGQLTGILQAGNPLVNPGFEVGLTDGGYEGQSQPDGTLGKMAIAPWNLRLNAPDLPDNTVPASFHHIGYEDGVTAAYVDVEYNAADDGKDLILAQFLTAPGATGAYVGGSDVNACFDARFYDAAGQLSSFFLTTNLGVDQVSHSIQTKDQTSLFLPADAAWHHYCLPYGNLVEGQTLNQFFFNFYYGTKGGESGASVPAARAHVQLDNVQLTGVTLQQGVTPRADPIDGYSVFVFPKAVSSAEGQSVVQQLSGLAGGKSGYVYELASMDYSGITAKSVDLAASPSVIFELLDQSNVNTDPSSPGRVTTVSSGHGGLFTAGAQNTFRMLAPDGSVSDRLLVVAPSTALNAASTTGKVGTVPWLFVQQSPDVTYTTVYGAASEPSSGYYSPARNAVMGFSLADQLDYQFTPLALSTQAGPSLAATPTLTLTCAAPEGGRCGDDANPTLTATLTTTSLVLEDVHVRLVSAINPTMGFGDATIATPSGSATFTLTAAQVSQLASTGSKTLKLVSDAATFENAAQSSTVDLGNFVPVASFSVSPGGTLSRISQVKLTDTSTDSDGTIAQSVWTITRPDNSVLGPVSGSGATPKVLNLAGQLHQVGTYQVHLLTVDNANGQDTKDGSFTLVDLAPVAKLSSPAFSGYGTVLFKDTSTDPDAPITAATREYSLDGGATWTPETGGQFSVPATSDGPLTAQIRVTDAEGMVSTASSTTLVDGTAPTSGISILPNLDASTWYNGNVDYSATSADTGGSGLLSTKVTIVRATIADTTTTSVSNAGPVSATATQDGAYTLTAFATDKAGNVGASVARSFKIDQSPPVISFTMPQMAGPVGGVFVKGDAMPVTASATDNVCRVLDVQFFVDGADAGDDSDATDGFGATIDTSSLTPGVHTLNAVATNEAGLFAGASTVYFVVIGN